MLSSLNEWVEVGRPGIRIGLSGFSYPDWKGAFHPGGLPSNRWFAYYAQRFSTVEVNVSFYRPVAPASLAKWKADAPPGFRFAFKASREITHDRKLVGCRSELDDLARRYGAMGDAAAWILFQLPPSLRVSTSRLHAFLEDAEAAFEASGFRARRAIEFRHASWYVDEVFAMLRARAWSPVIHDMQRAGGWSIEGGEIGAGERRWSVSEFAGRYSPTIYLRLHGPTGDYSGSYADERLAAFASLLNSGAEGGGAWAYLNNTKAAAAIDDARRLAGLVALRPIP